MLESQGKWVAMFCTNRRLILVNTMFHKSLGKFHHTYSLGAIVDSDERIGFQGQRSRSWQTKYGQKSTFSGHFVTI